MRQGGRVRLSSVLLATGINREGYREILGLMIGDSEPVCPACLPAGRRQARELDTARRLKDEVVQGYAACASKAVERLEMGFEDAVAVMALPAKYRKRLRTTNGVERLNREIRHRERVIRIFPNEESTMRLIGAVLMEIHEAWTTRHRYFDMAKYWEWRRSGATQKMETTSSETA